MVISRGHKCGAVVITKKGSPVAKPGPVGSPSDDFLGKLSGVMKIVADITQPLDEAEVWNALR
jgi:hypothetical protein